MMSDPNPHVRETTAWTLSRIAKVSPEPLEVNILRIAIEKVRGALRDSPNIAIMGCLFFHNIYERQSLEESNILSPYIEDVWETAFREDAFSGVGSLNQAFLAMNTLMESASPDTQNLYLNQLVIRLEETLSPQFKFIGHSEEYQREISSLMQLF